MDAFGFGFGIDFVPTSRTFSPLSLSPALWLKADAGTNQTASGTAATADADPVGEWQDQGGNGNHLAQATASKRGTLKLNIQNGRPVIRFDGTDDFLVNTTGLVTVLKNVTGGSIALVGKQRTVSAGTDKAWAFASISAAGSTRMALRSDRTAAGKMEGGGRRLDADTFAGVLGAVVDTSAFHAHIAVNDYGNAKAYLYQDGTLQATTDPFQTVGSTSNTSSSGVSVGASDNGSPSPIDLCEVLILGRVLTAQELTNLSLYFRSRWGTP